MTEIELIIELHKDAQRQGPGSYAETVRALDMIGDDKNTLKKIADIGCGSGASTLALAKNTSAHITAVDLFPEFLEKLQQSANAQGYNERISTETLSMDDLPFADDEFDMIWSEGAIYNMGFENGIKAWRKYIRTGGYLAVSEITWKTATRPEEIDLHWNREYPEIDTASNKVRILEQNGYSLVGYFALPEYCWIDNYYRPMQERFSEFTDKHGNTELAQSIVETERREIALYETYKDYYSYGFYIAQKL